MACISPALHVTAINLNKCASVLFVLTMPFTPRRTNTQTEKHNEASSTSPNTNTDSPKHHPSTTQAPLKHHSSTSPNTTQTPLMCRLFPSHSRVHQQNFAFFPGAASIGAVARWFTPSGVACHCAAAGLIAVFNACCFLLAAHMLTLLTTRVCA